MKRMIIVFATICFMAVMAWGDDWSTGLVPSEGFIEVTGGKVWYRIVGSGERTPLLVLHGGPGVSSVYLKPLEALADDRPVIFYDQLGCGNSPAPSDTTLWTIERFVGEIAQVREALGLKEIHLYGHSWGTMLAVDYMLTKPSGIRSLVLSSPLLSRSRWLRDEDSLMSTLPDSLQEVIRHHRRLGTTDAPEYLSAMKVYSERYHARRLPWSADLDSAFAQWNQAMFEYMFAGALGTYDRTDRLSEIDIPTLLTAGQYDKATPATVKYYQSLIPGAEFALLKNCAHLTMHDDPEIDIRIIREFLAKVKSK
jgi:proline iminopeptidase